MVGEVGADPTIPEVRDLQSRAVADLLLSRFEGFYPSILLSVFSKEKSAKKRIPLV